MIGELLCYPPVRGVREHVDVLGVLGQQVPQGLLHATTTTTTTEGGEGWCQMGGAMRG